MRLLATAAFAALAVSCSTPKHFPGTDPSPSPSPTKTVPASCAETSSCTVTLTWTRAADTPGHTIAGYHIYERTGSQAYDYTRPIEAFNNDHLDLPNFGPGTYYFVARSYDQNGQESIDSNTASATIQTTGATAMSKEMKVVIGGISTPKSGAATGTSCSSSSNLVNDMLGKIAPCDAAANQVLEHEAVVVQHVTVHVTRAVYGGVDVLSQLQSLCDGKQSCDFDLGDLPSPPGSSKRFDVEWACEHNPKGDTKNSYVLPNGDTGFGVPALYCSMRLSN